MGPERIVETARQLGIESPLNPYPSLALGASEVSPLELTRAFGVLAAGGFKPEPKTLFYREPRGEEVYEPAETYLVTSALRGAVERGTGQGIRDRGFNGDVAAKSGTTNDFRDGWFVGYTPSLVVGVWVGFDHGNRLELPGAGVALPIFADFLVEALGPSGRQGPWGDRGFSYPSGLEMVDVDPATGLRGGWGCRGEPELFLRGTAPRESCGGFRWGEEIHLDSRTLRLLLERGGEEVSRALRRLIRGEGRD
jgi:membrane carboxypeptidase/penicillin-binding protein